MKLKIDNNDYKGFNNLFSKGRKHSVSIEEFNKMNKLTTARTMYTNYEILTFTKGEMLLVRLTPVKVDGEYKMEDVIIVPEDMKSIFQER